MRVTTKGRYALRALIALGEMSESGEPVSIRAIAERERLSSDFLEQIFNALRRAGLIASVRGPGGGYYIAREPGTISVRDILEASGEDLELSPDEEGQPARGARGRRGKAEQVWRRLGEGFLDQAGSISLLDILSGN